MSEDALVTSRDWPAPAKINRFLHITGRREDGYHLLQTVFQFLDVGDRLSFAIDNRAAVRRLNRLEGVSEEQDLVVRAARLLQAESGTGQGVAIEVDKRLPMGGGLGGGSSDAATTLVALNCLWQLGFSAAELDRLGLSLGADVPIFVEGYAAWAEGVGEELTPVELDEPWFLVVIPPVKVETGVIFGAAELTRDCQPITIRDFLAGEGGNVCETVVCKAYPEVEKALQWLKGYAPARMTGTGACLFAPFASREEAQAVFEQLPERWQGFVARGLNRSPLQARLERAEL